MFKYFMGTTLHKLHVINNYPLKHCVLVKKMCSKPCTNNTYNKNKTNCETALQLTQLHAYNISLQYGFNFTHLLKRVHRCSDHYFALNQCLQCAVYVADFYKTSNLPTYLKKCVSTYLVTKNFRCGTAILTYKSFFLITENTFIQRYIKLVQT